MILWPISDLHQEFVRDRTYGGHPATAFDPAEHAPANFDVVVAAGDIDVTVLRSLRWLADRFPGVRVIYTQGNHCAYSDADAPEGPRTIDELTEMGLELADKLGITMLMDSSQVIDGVRFAGGTLWTDFMTVGRANIRAKMAEASGQRGQNDYKHIRRWSTKDPTKRKRFRPEDSIALHRRTQRYLDEVSATPFDGPTVFVTHHAPHPNSLNPKFDRMNWCDASDLSLMMDVDGAPDLWVHGHIHGHSDYTVGRTRIVKNARGYQFSKDEDMSFQPSFTLEVGPRPVSAPIP